MNLARQCVAWLVVGLSPLVMAQNDRLEVTSSSFAFESYEFDIELPQGFLLELLNAELNKPRVIFFHGERMLIGSRSGAVYWLEPPYTKANTLIEFDRYPHSVVVRDNKIYVARTDGIFVADYSQQTDVLSPDDFTRYVSLPGGRGHNTRTLKVGPDRLLYVSLGIRFNCSGEYLDASVPIEERRGGIFVIDETDAKPHLKPVASGLRNPVGFDWHPEDDTLYANNNGADHLGYDVPPELFVRATSGSFHGMPWFYYDGESFAKDPCIESQSPRPVSDIEGPVAVFPARSAPMDMVFVKSNAFGEAFRNSAVVALHGSWATSNGGLADGDPETRRAPRLVLVSPDAQQDENTVDLLTGFQRPDGLRWARPVGVQFGPDEALYFTSDAGIEGLFRLRREK